MKRGLCLFCTVAVLLCSCSKPAPNYTHGVYELTFQEENISNDHVGNDWSFTYFYDKAPVKDGFEICYPLDHVTSVPVSVKVCETDKYSDVAEGSLQVELYDGSEASVEITVVENNGRYKGNTAVWKITCTVHLTDKK